MIYWTLARSDVSANIKVTFTCDNTFSDVCDTLPCYGSFNTLLFCEPLTAHVI